MKHLLCGLAGLALITASSPSLAADKTVAPGGPGVPSNWAVASKTGVGTSYEAYSDGRFKDTGPTGKVSKVWFSIAGGVLTETMYGLIHEAQIRQLQFAIMTETGLALETADTTSTTQYLRTDNKGRAQSPAYRIINRDKAGRFEIEKHFFSDPDHNTLFMRFIIRPLKGKITPYLLLEPHMANTAGGDQGQADRSGLYAQEGKVALALKTSSTLERASVGFMGTSDGLTDLKVNGALSHTYSQSGAQPGTLMLTAQLATLSKTEQTYDFALGFGPDHKAASAAASASLKSGYAEVLAHYNGDGKRVGWRDYVASLSALPKLATESGDGGKLAYASALMLKVHEDKTYAGALIASLSNPWGDTTSAQASGTGYKAVWPRDFYQCAMALAALGDRQTPVAAFRYLKTVQVTDKTPGNTGVGGWFQQKSHVDGTAEWVGVQLDQTAMPIMLGWKLHSLGLISSGELNRQYKAMLKPAADFLVTGGKVGLGWNKETITPPYSQQERWEEQGGYSPSTTAAVITGLVAASEIAKGAGDTSNSDLYRTTAKAYADAVEARMFTKSGALGNGHYYLRLSQSQDPNKPGLTEARNGLEPITADKMGDAGFLELVRYGVRRADDPHVIESLAVIDDQTRSDDLRVRYDLAIGGQGPAHPGFRRYGHDGYGEDAVTGANYGADGGQMSPGQRGRVWPLLTGERGHYALALASLKGAPTKDDIRAIKTTYVRALEAFANQGLMISEQVYDGVGAQLKNPVAAGQGTGSATPLAWAHAEYIKLLRSVHDRQVWDDYPPVRSMIGSEAKP